MYVSNAFNTSALPLRIFLPASTNFKCLFVLSSFKNLKALTSVIKSFRLSKDPTCNKKSLSCKLKVFRMLSSSDFELKKL
jgi:hypothetical protein